MMNLTKDQKLHGFNATHFRNALIAVYSGNYTRSALKKVNVVTEKQLKKFEKLILDEKYLVYKPIFEGGPTQITLSKKGAELCRAKCIKRMSRKLADKHYHKLLDNIKEINTNPFYKYEVSEAYIFGSYLDDNKDSYGDIDVAVKLEYKDKDKTREEELQDNLNAYVNESKSPIAYINQLSFLEDKVYRKVKNKNPRLHVGYKSELEHLKCPHKKIAIFKYNVKTV